jgi:hypothetical protein
VKKSKKQPPVASETGSTEKNVTAPTGPTSPGRRNFIGSVGAVVAVSATGLGLDQFGSSTQTTAKAAEVGPLTNADRRGRALEIKGARAKVNRAAPIPTFPQPCNGDETTYSNRIGNYSKGLPHNALGEVTPAAYNALLTAMTTGLPADFNAIPIGGTVKLTSPQAALKFQLEGSDSHQFQLPPAPALNSAWEAGEMVEDYWMALTRDVNFTDYATDPTIANAVAGLNALSDFRGPKVSGLVTPQTIFRCDFPGVTTGHYLSQFLLKQVPYGAFQLDQKIRTVMPGVNYMTTFSSWLNIQNGGASGPDAFDSTPRYIRNMRDLGEYVHRDFPVQAALNAALIILTFGGGALDAANPYIGNPSQAPFATFGGPDVFDLIGRVGVYSLYAAWFQKWSVHRRLRPEEYGGLVHNHMTMAASYPLHPDVLNSTALQAVFAQNGTYLLPMAFPEGCPTHPAYPAGHGAFAGATITMLKAFFRESFVIPNPVVPTADGTALVPYTGPDAGTMTIGQELNKLAANIFRSRDGAGVHWQTDGIQGALLGEQVAINVLRDLKATYNETFAGFSLTKFDGTTITV